MLSFSSFSSCHSEGEYSVFGDQSDSFEIGQSQTHHQSRFVHEGVMMTLSRVFVADQTEKRIVEQTKARHRYTWYSCLDDHSEYQCSSGNEKCVENNDSVNKMSWFSAHCQRIVFLHELATCIACVCIILCY